MAATDPAPEIEFGPSTVETDDDGDFTITFTMNVTPPAK